MAQKQQKIYKCCGKVSFTFSKADNCTSCAKQAQRENKIVEYNNQLLEWGYINSSFQGYDDKFGKMLFSVTCPDCALTQTWKYEHIRHRMSIDSSFLPCQQCGKKRRIKQAQAGYMKKHGRDYSAIDYSVKKEPKTAEDLADLLKYHLANRSPASFYRSSDFKLYCEYVQNVSMPGWESLEEKLFALKSNTLTRPVCKCGDPLGFVNNRLLKTCVKCCSKLKTLNVLDYKNPKCKSTKLNVWPHQLANKQLISSMVKHRLGASEKVPARKCEVRIVSRTDARDFLNENHLSGWANAKYNFGLYLNNVLLSIMSFDKPRFDTSYDWELIRLATKQNHVIVGGPSKLLDFSKNYISGKVLCYSDNLLGEGKVYKSIGFNYVGETGKGYFWVKGGTVLSRYAAQKHKLPNLLGNVDMSKTANLIMTEAGWLQVFDAGNKKWEIDLTSKT